MQNGRPQLWALVEPENPKQLKLFRLAGTGYDVDDEKLLRFVGTFQPTPELVFHLFEGRGK